MTDGKGATPHQEAAPNHNTNNAGRSQSISGNGADEGGGSITWGSLPLDAQHVAMLMASGIAPEQARERTIEARLRRELRKFAIELRKLAYSLPHGIGEHALLQVSERMGAVADQDHGAGSASLANQDPLAVGRGIEQEVLAEPDEAQEA